MNFIKTNPITVLLMFFNVFSFIFILQIMFGIIPLFSTNTSENNVKNINSFVLAVSYSTLPATIFYLFTVTYPNFIKKKEAFKVIQPRLETIVNALHHSVKYLLFKRLNIFTDSINKKLLLSDFDNIQSLNSEKMDMNYRILGKHGGWIPFGSGEITEIQHFERERNLIKTKIDEIFSTPSIKYVDDELIVLLTQLKDCWFYAGVDAHLQYGDRVSVQNFNTGVHDYYQLYIKLSQHLTPVKFQIIY